MYFFGSLELKNLAAMSYDHYLAMCKLLHYVTLMNRVRSPACSWLLDKCISGSYHNSIVHITINFLWPQWNGPFLLWSQPCVKALQNWHLLMALTAFIFGSIFTFPPILLIVMLSVAIIGTILRLSSATGKQKSFSICSSHLMVVAAFYGTLTIVYVLPNNDTLGDLNKVGSVFNMVLTPLLNPLIYHLRNWEEKEALRKRLSKFVLCTRMQTLWANLFRIKWNGENLWSHCNKWELGT